MVDVKKITKGRIARAPRVLIYGFEAVGKTKFAAGAPKPFMLDIDRGSHKFEEVERVSPDSWGETIAWLDWIEKGQVKCETVVIDSVTSLEAMLHNELFPNSTIEAYDGGFGRGDTYAVNKWRELLASLERIWMLGKTIVLTAHATTKAFNDPTGPSFDRFELSVRPKTAAAIRQVMDYVLFAREEVVIAGKKNQTKATTTGVRHAYTRRCPAYDAKARGTLLFPAQILLSWDVFAAEIKKDETRQTELQDEIKAMLAEIADKSLDVQVAEFLKEHPESILNAHNRVAEKLDEHRKKLNAAQAAG